jgi:hypothetical protein
MVATFVDKTLALDELTLSGTVVRSVIGNGCLEMRMSTTSRGSGNNYLKGTPTFDFAHIVPEPATPAALSPITEQSVHIHTGTWGVCRYIHIHINRPSPPTTQLLFRSHGRGKPDDASYRRTTSGCS